MPLRRRKEDATAAATTAAAPKKTPQKSKAKNGSGPLPPASPKRATSTSTKKKLNSDADDHHNQKSHRRAVTLFAVAVALLATTYALWQQNKALRAALSPLAQLARETELFGGGISALENLRDVAADVLRSGASSRAALLASSPGLAAAAAGLGPHHPVVLIPGFVTSSLELWSGPRCASKYFRSRFWGGLSMTTRLLGDKRCWLETMALDPKTGLDPKIPIEEGDEEEGEEGEVEKEKKSKEEEDKVEEDGTEEQQRRRRRTKNEKLKKTTRLRAVEGLAGVDYFMPGYGVWSRVIEELARLGHDATNLAAETYDWRLRVPDLEKRDGYFTRLKSRVETMVETNRKKSGERIKVAILAHSWGDSVARAFFLWADARDIGWTERHVAVYLNIAGPTLGAAKSLPALLSGETRDTAELGAVAAFLGENYVPRGLRAKLFRTWPGAFGMLPLGGKRVWGSSEHGAPDDTAAMKKRGISHGALLTVRDVSFDEGEEEGKKKQQSKLDVDGALDLLADNLPSHAAAHVSEAISGAAGGRRSRNKSGSGTSDGNDSDDGSSPDIPCSDGAVDPLRCPLPHAPSMRLYCIYGVGKPTERSYVYLKSTSPPPSSPSSSSESTAASEAKEAAKGESTPGRAASAAAEAANEAEHLWGRIDTEANEDDGIWKEDDDGGNASSPPSPSPSSSHPPSPSRPFGSLENGVRVSDGDGTVPLISLGTLCARHWRGSSQPSRLNPSNLTVVTREAKHAPLEFLIGGTLDPRGGAGSADHVDILMNEHALRDIVDIVSGRGERMKDRIFSDIREIAARVEI